MGRGDAMSKSSDLIEKPREKLNAPKASQGALNGAVKGLWLEYTGAPASFADDLRVEIKNVTQRKPRKTALRAWQGAPAPPDAA